MISQYSPLVLCSSKRQYPGSKMARVLNWRNGWGFKIPLGCRILMDGASSTLGESFVQFWPKLLLLWCKSAVLLVQVPFWCKQQQQSGARVVLPPLSSSCGGSRESLEQALSDSEPRAHCLARRHTQVKPAPPLSLSLSLPPFVPRPPLTVLLHYLLCLLLLHHLLLNIVPPKIFSYEMAFSTFSLIEKAFGCNSSSLHFFL